MLIFQPMQISHEKSVLSVMKADIQSAEKNGKEMNDVNIVLFGRKPKEMSESAELVHGEPCPICKTTLEWESTRECDNCGYDKP